MFTVQSNVEKIQLDSFLVQGNYSMSWVCSCVSTIIIKRLKKSYAGSQYFFFQNTAQLQYVEDSEPVTRSTWPLVNSAKTEMQVQKELDKKRFQPRLIRGATSYTETVEYQDCCVWKVSEFGKTINFRFAVIRSPNARTDRVTLGIL